jgi:hypothetical protein
LKDKRERDVKVMLVVIRDIYSEEWKKYLMDGMEAVKSLLILIHFIV